MADEKQKDVIEDIKFTEVKKEKFDPLNSEPIVENLRKARFAPPPNSKPFETIPEPQFQEQQARPMNNFGDAKFSSQPQANGSSSSPHSSQQTAQPVNPEFQEMPDAEKQAAAEQAAEMILSLYGGIKGAAPKLIVITERKLKKMEKDGLINLSIPLQTSPNNPTRVNILDIIKQFNASVSEGYTVSEEFKATVRPALIRVLKVNGIGLNDTQFLMFAFGQDLIQTIFHLIDGMRQRKEVLDQLKEINENIKNGTMNFAPPPPPPPQQPQAQRNEPEEVKPKRERAFDNAEVKSASSGGQKPDLIINGKNSTKRGRKRDRIKPE